MTTEPTPQSLAVRQEPAPQEHGLTLMGDPQEAVDNAARAAKALMTIVRQGKVSKRINDKEYLFYEAWQTIAHFYGVTVGCDHDEAVGDGQGWVAYATAYRRGEPVSHAIAQCTRAERMWAAREDFQLRSMAQTRACGKALRNVLAFVAVLGGYAPTPAEEMEQDTAPVAPPAAVQAPHGVCECGQPFVKTERMTWPAHRAADGTWHNKPKPATAAPQPLLDDAEGGGDDAGEPVAPMKTATAQPLGVWRGKSFSTWGEWAFAVQALGIPVTKVVAAAKDPAIKQVSQFPDFGAACAVADRLIAEAATGRTKA